MNKSKNETKKFSNEQSKKTLDSCQHWTILQ